AGEMQSPYAHRSFPLMFFDPLAIALDPTHDLKRESWSVEVSAGADPTIQAVNRGANQSLAIATASSVLLCISLILVASTLRARAELVEMRAELVSAVTHELKTPLTSIRAASETLASGWLASGDALRDYAAILVEASKRLTRLVENLLAYARVTDATDVYAREPLEVREIVDESLRDFFAQLEEL